MNESTDTSELSFGANNLKRLKIQKQLSNFHNNLFGYQQLMEHSQDIISTISLQGKFVTISKAAERILGYSTAELLGSSFTTFVHPDDLEATHATAAQILNGHPVTNFVNRYIKKDKNYVYLSWHTTWSEEHQLAYSIARDITETKQIEGRNLEKLNESEYHLTEVGKIARAGSWEYDIINDVSYWSPAIYDIYELPYDFDPTIENALKFYKEPYKGMLKKTIDKASLDGSPWDLELELTTAKDQKTWIRSSGSAVYKDGKIVKLKGVFMDIDKYRTNEAALDLLTRHNKQLNGFTHILSHNLRNHASNISLLLNFIDKDELSKENCDLINKLEHVSDNLNNTLDLLSDAIKIREHIIPADEIDFDELTKEILVVLETDINTNNASITTDYTVPQISFPKIYLESIMVNLISNSLKYKKLDEQPEIIISTYWDDQQRCIVMEYQDNGIGIDLAQHGDKVFGLYKTFSNRPNAHGVGLFLVKTQIESQGGYIIIESKPNVGTVFRVFFKPEI
jgi:PAS domain S-box-containing protein